MACSCSMSRCSNQAPFINANMMAMASQPVRGLVVGSYNQETLNFAPYVKTQAGYAARGMQNIQSAAIADEANSGSARTIQYANCLADAQSGFPSGAKGVFCCNTFNVGCNNPKFMSGR